MRDQSVSGRGRKNVCRAFVQFNFILEELIGLLLLYYFSASAFCVLLNISLSCLNNIGLDIILTSWIVDLLMRLTTNTVIVMGKRSLKPVFVHRFQQNVMECVSDHLVMYTMTS